MKLRTKSIITLVAMLLSGIGAFAADGTDSPHWTVSYQYDGEASTSDAPGIVECTFSGTTATIVCRPLEGNYITAEDIIVEKTVSGDKAQTREVGIDSTPITITAASTNTTPRAESSYTFTAEADPNLTYEIKANFHQLKDLDTYALIALPENTIYTYTGDAIKPEITVTASGVNLTAETDYTVTYADNINAGQGSITITATETTFYTGSKTVNFYINQADVSFWFETSDGQEAKELTTTYGATFTKPVLKMSETGAADVIGVVYSVDNEEVATINATTGELTILKAGTVVVTAAAAEDYTNKEGSNYKADPTNTKTSYSLTINSATPTLQFSKETAEATMGAEFEAPTLTVTPEGLVPIEYESTNTEVATVDKNTGVVTLVGGGETTIKAVFPGNETYETALASYILTVSEVTPQTVTVTLTFSEKTVSATLGAEFAAPALTVTPEGLQGVKYSSSNTNVATVNETTGAVTLVAAGETTIKATFAGNDNYEAAEASYTLTVNRAQSEGYGLWINDIQVTEDNQDDVLGNSADSKSGTMGTIVFNPEKNTLVMTNDVSNVEIESRLESLTLHINDVNKVKSIRFNNLGDATKTGKLAITTNGNFPGQIIITNDAGVSAISGFSEITLNMGLQYLEPELVEIENGELYKYDWDNTNSDNPVKDPTTKAVCDAVTIGVVITPLTKNVTVSMTNASNYTAKDENGNTILDENGNPKTVSMMNFAQNKDILLTLWTKNDEDNYQKGNDGDWPDAGFDNSDGDPGITMVITMTDAQALAVAASVLANTIQPGGTTYSMEFKGATFIVPAGSGEIDVWVKTDPGYVYKLLPVGLSGETHKLDFNSPSIKEYQDLGNGKIKVTVEYNNLPTQTYYMLYLTEEAPSGARGGTRLGKRDKAHGKLYSVGVRPRSITDVNPASEASGGVIEKEEDPEGVIDNPTPPTPPTGIQTVASESSVNSNKWFTADGRQLEGRPTKPGFYIRNGKKVILK